MEVEPQALEWYFSQACAYPFRVSVDNLDPISGALPDTLDFRRRVAARARRWQQRGLPARADIFGRALALAFGTGFTLEAGVFKAELIE